MDAAVPGSRATNGEASANSAPTVDPSNPFADLFQASFPPQSQCFEALLKTFTIFGGCSHPRLPLLLGLGEALLLTHGQQLQAPQPQALPQARPGPALARRAWVVLAGSVDWEASVAWEGWAGWEALAVWGA